ncbi:MAG TPA: flagellar basal-body MS-ring/collar protein FliF [Bryobacteraceae bacterium]|nr:flagellar basal-body MS-ring/collar protein FliF [Bryobacteraceae bacterium]HOQ45783.1 flagellar basal-body MS-ring/collar protein FliF [Bryobacteraceae bacterium]HPQ15928.1 flagellar basal-body MS-ring/collar protein FliF [Bryobacteraceae bacterium]HPU71490.1 flagellar basal-body MS-ring/collar protein FliF [Bryobacteraceae bacterium]
MDQIKKLYASLSVRQRISIAAAAVLVIAGLVAFTNWRRERDFRPLFSGMSPEDAAAVVQKLRESGTPYRLTENGTGVLVPSAQVAELRLQMAGAGLPKTGRVGFELFDQTNFGVTDFTEHVNYRRAVEGELERSIMALAEVEQARVHVTFPKDSVFLESRQPAKASVMVRLRPGAKLAPANVTAICHLVASAVEGLAPESISVLDMNGNLLSRPRRESLDGEPPSEAMLEYRQKVEKDLVMKINSTLEPLLGPDKFRAGVSVECDFSGGEQSEETFDPSRSVMVSSEKTEDVSGANLASGIPGTASALPRPTSRPGMSGAGAARRTENITYQTSRLVRKTRLPQGTIRRMSVAVLLDQNVRWEGAGPNAKRIIEPPSPERVKAIRDLVAAATGLDASRGDQLIVESLPFESTLSAEPPPLPESPPPPPAPFALPAWLQQLIQQRDPVLIGAAALVALLVLLGAAFLVLRRRKRRKVEMAKAVAGGQAMPELASPEDVEQAEKQLEAQLAEQQAMKHRLEVEALKSLKLPPVTTKKAEVLTKHLTETAKKDPVKTAQILRSWLYDLD